MTTYRLVSGHDTFLAMEQEINRLLSLGWKLQGGIAVCHSVASGYADRGRMFYAQAMTQITNEHGDVL